MEDFKQYLSEDADEHEQDAARQVMEGLAGIRIENKVAEIAAERRKWLRRRFWRRIILAAALTIIAGVAVWFFKGIEANKSPRLEQPVQQDPIAIDNPSSGKAPEILPQTQKGKGSIAQNQAPGQLPPPHFSAPVIRGENEENTQWKTLLDKIWYTDYPLENTVLSKAYGEAEKLLKTRDFNNAYIQLKRLEGKFPENDTLRYLKGYCLMEMGEGSDALRYFEDLESRHPDWEQRLEWYRGLSQLLSGDKEKALKTFRAIESTPGQPYLNQSKKAIQLLK